MDTSFSLQIYVVVLLQTSNQAIDGIIQEYPNLFVERSLVVIQDNLYCISEYDFIFLFIVDTNSDVI